MRRTSKGAVFTVGFGQVLFTMQLAARFAMPSSAPSCTPSSFGRHFVPVRFYNQSRLSEDDLQTIRKVANRIWAPYGIVIETVSEGDGVSVTVSGDLVSARAGDVDAPAVIGTTMFLAGHATPNIRLSVGAAEQLLDPSGGDTEALVARPISALSMFVPRMLGLALAHELAHYLLDTSEHSPEGLLRPRFPLAEMKNVRPSRLRLSCAQQRALSIQ